MAYLPFVLRSFYEGLSMQKITFPIRLMMSLGVQKVIGKRPRGSSASCSLTSSVTNAAGGLNPDYSVGDLMILNDVGFER